MANATPALCKTTTTTSGTSDYVLSTSANTGPFRTLEQAVADGSLADGDVVTYLCQDTTVTGDAQFEMGTGIYTDSTDTLARTAGNVIDGSSGPGVLISWGVSGQRDIIIIGVASGPIHINSGDAGSVTVASDANDLIIESSTATGMSILSPDANTSAINMASPSDNAGTALTWNYNNSVFSVKTSKSGAVIRFSADTGASYDIAIKANGDLEINGGLINLTQTSTAANPTTTEYPTDGDVGVHHNTVSGDRFMVWNDGGTIFKVVMT